jgi:hypothetical protein
LLGATNIKVRKELDPTGKVENIVATRPLWPETVEDPSDDELQRIRGYANDLGFFLQAFLGSNLTTWALSDLDRAFSAWQLSADQGRFTSERVVEITGAAFGEYCNRHLRSRWLMISDAAGSGAAIRSESSRVTGWPFSTVRKRIEDNECDFFVPVYESLRRSVEEPYAD